MQISNHQHNQGPSAPLSKKYGEIANKIVPRPEEEHSLADEEPMPLLLYNLQLSSPMQPQVTKLTMPNSLLFQMVRQKALSLAMESRKSPNGLHISKNSLLN